MKRTSSHPDATTSVRWQHVWVLIRRPDGGEEEIDLPAGLYVEIGDVLSNGSVVIDLPYPDDTNEDIVEIEFFEDEEE
jgi:hypothetical protein